MNIISFRDRRKTAPVKIKFDAIRPEGFPVDAEAAFAAIIDHLRSAAAILASATDSDFAEIFDMAHRLDQQTDDEIAVDALVTMIDWEDEEREFFR